MFRYLKVTDAYKRGALQWFCRCLPPFSASTRTDRYSGLRKDSCNARWSPTGLVSYEK